MKYHIVLLSRCLGVGLALLYSWNVFAIDPRWNFRVMLSPNFEIIYREDQKALAKRYLLAAEQAHELLHPLFKEGPSRTIVVLQDDTDNSNGLANFIPYAHIVIYPVLPNQGDSTDEYGDWALEVMIHEYAHILNMYPAHGVIAPFKYIFGSVIRPNALLPRWWLEGLAVNLETRLTEFGRLRSTQTQALARAFQLGDRFKREDIATINEVDSRTYPFGSRPYLYGGWWWDEAHRIKGDEVIYKWNQNFSRRIPFLLNGPVREQTGMSASELLNQSKRKVATLAQNQIEVIRRARPSEANEVFQGKGFLGRFSLSPSATRLIYWQGIVDQGVWAYARTRESNGQAFKDRPEETLFRTLGTNRFSWVNDDVVIFDQTDHAAPYTTFRDLFRYDFKTGKTERLTTGLRAEAPAVSPNGELVAFVQNDGGRNRISLLELKTERVRVLVNGNFTQRLASPEFLNDNELLFSARLKTGEEKIYRYDFATQKSRVWNSTLKAAQDIRRTSKGILVSDAGSGVRNIFHVQADQAQALTNTLTLAQTPDYDPQTDQLLFGEITPDGPRLRATAWQTRDNPPAIPRPEFETPLAPDTAKIKIEERGFYPITYLRPRYWIPFIYPTEDGLIVQGTTSMSDPIGRNTYTLFGSYDTVTKEPSYGLGYANRSFPVGLTLDYGKYITYLGASGRIIESQDAGLGFFGNLGTRYTSWHVSGSYSETDGRTLTYKRVGPQVGLEYSGLNSPYHGNLRWHLEANHRQYLEQDGYLAYGRSYAHLAMVANLGSHKMGLQARGAVSPDLPFGYVLDLGDRSVGGNYIVNLANSQFLLRGYPSGAFVGRRIFNGNFEYVLPASEIGRGIGTFPLFFRNLEVAAFFDAMAVDGGGFHVERNGYIRSKMGEFYTGTGAELRLNTTMAYHLPLSVIVGLYYGLNTDYGGGFTTFLGMGLGSLSPIHSKTP